MSEKSLSAENLSIRSCGFEQFRALGEEPEQVHDVLGDEAGFFQLFGFFAYHIDCVRAVAEPVCRVYKKIIKVTVIDIQEKRIGIIGENKHVF